MKCFIWDKIEHLIFFLIFKSIKSIIIPSIWNINSGCRSKLHLYPFDPDGDRIECSWALYKNESANPAFKLDQSECIIYYDPALDYSKDKNSVMKIEIQDLSGNETEYFSSIPVQFVTNILKQNESLIYELQDSAGHPVNDRCSRHVNILKLDFEPKLIHITDL